MALLERTRSSDGCYPAPVPLAAAIRRQAGLDADVADDFDSVRDAGVVHVIRRRARCGRVRMAIRADAGLYVLNSARGPVHIRGRGEEPSRAARAAARGPLRAVTLTRRSFTLTRADQVKRLAIGCPRRRFPLGGGLTGTPPPGSDGEGIYPHSFERLGVQRGFHVSVVLIDPSPEGTVPREAEIQVVCGLGLVPTASPRRTAFMRPGETESAVARCPRGTRLFSGGFQRTNLRTPLRTTGGNFVTESRALGARAWRVTGQAVGVAGGELTAIAHCTSDRRPRLREMTATAPLPAGSLATATTVPCPRGHRLIAGGFSFNGSPNAFFAAGTINGDETWSASGFGYLGPSPAGLTAYGYCLRV